MGGKCIPIYSSFVWFPLARDLVDLVCKWWRKWLYLWSKQGEKQNGKWRIDTLVRGNEKGWDREKGKGEKKDTHRADKQPEAIERISVKGGESFGHSLCVNGLRIVLELIPKWVNKTGEEARANRSKIGKQKIKIKWKCIKVNNYAKYSNHNFRCRINSH